MSTPEAKKPVDPVTAFARALGASSESIGPDPDNKSYSKPPTARTLIDFSSELHSIPGN